MKKTLALVLSLVMVLAIAVPVFATDFDITPVAPFFDGMQINWNKTNPDQYGSDVNIFRQLHTPSRCFDYAYDSSAVVMNETESYFKWVGQQWLENDCNDMDNAGAIELYQLTMKRGETLTAFAGHAFDYSRNGDNGTTRATEYRVANTSEKFVGHTGFGYTFLKDSKSKVRFYVLYLGEVDAQTNAAPVQAMYVDYDTGKDLTKDYHDYKVYYTSNSGVGQALFFVDDVTVAKVTFENNETYACNFLVYNEDGTTTSTIDNPDRKYAKTASLYGPDGKLVASTTSSLISPNSGNMSLTVCGKADELYTTRHIRKTLQATEVPAENYVPNPVTGDNFAIYAVVAVVAVATIGSAVVVRRKKETQF